jgi:hypothetical protein
MPEVTGQHAVEVTGQPAVEATGQAAVEVTGQHAVPGAAERTEEQQRRRQQQQWVQDPGRLLQLPRPPGGFGRRVMVGQLEARPSASHLPLVMAGPLFEQLPRGQAQAIVLPCARCCGCFGNDAASICVVAWCASEFLAQAVARPHDRTHGNCVSLFRLLSAWLPPSSPARASSSRLSRSPAARHPA